MKGASICKLISNRRDVDYGALLLASQHLYKQIPTNDPTCNQTTSNHQQHAQPCVMELRRIGHFLKQIAQVFRLMALQLPQATSRRLPVASTTRGVSLERGFARSSGSRQTTFDRREPVDTILLASLGGVSCRLAAKRVGHKGRARRVARSAGLLNNIKDFFAKNLASDGGKSNGNPDAVRIRVSSGMSIGQPFCGEYEEQEHQCNGRPVYMKLGLPANSQAVYLLYNEANQWAFTPHADGRPDGWAFVTDPALDPPTIAGTFSIWDGSEWVPDTTLKLLAPGQIAVQEAAQVEVVKQPSGLQDIEHAEPAQPVNAQTALPDKVKNLSLLHWKSHWKASQRCLVKWPEGPSDLEKKLLPSHPGVRRGVLPNGLRYVVLRNAMPPKRFEAHIELHVGSIDEDPDEQGIAHMMEHVCFLGSRKRERLIGTGSRSNALTDFQHTIYHIHAPVKMEDGRSMYPLALEALSEIAFGPEMLNHRIEKERKAVLAEMQQVNDMEYRIETWTLSGLHETNKLGSQFPIGKEEQIKAWQQKDLRNFHEKWYYPGNATLYVVGDLDETEMIDGIKKVFEHAQARHKPSPDSAIMDPVWGEESADSRSLFRRRIARHRPEQLHNFSLPMIGTNDSRWIVAQSRLGTASRSQRSQGWPKRQKMAKIIYTHTDEAPMLATYSLLPIIQAMVRSSNVRVETSDISVAARIIALFPEKLRPQQRLRDALSDLGKLCQKPEANIIKLPNVSASVPQLKEAIKELQGQGYGIPDYPEDPKDDEEKKVQEKYKKVLGSAVNPVLREGNSDRRAASSVKNYAKKHPHRMGAWTADSKTHVSSMTEGDFFGSERSVTLESDTDVKIVFESDSGSTTTLKEKLSLVKGEILDAAAMSTVKLREYLEKDLFLEPSQLHLRTVPPVLSDEEINDAKAKDVMLSLHLKATMMKISDPILFGHVVSIYFKDVFAKYEAEFKALGVNPNFGLDDLYKKLG
eukprot:s2007_g4.t1